MQSIMVLLSSDPEVLKHFTKIELLAAIISGCVHDVDHPVSIYQRDVKKTIYFRRVSTTIT